MPEPVARFEYVGAKVLTQVEVVNGIPLVFIDVITPDGHPDIAIGWDTKWQRFGVYADGEEVFPPGDGTSNVTDTDVDG